MAECRYRAQCRGSGRSSARSERTMERLENMPMNRYINPNTMITRTPGGCCGRGEEQVLLEQLVELSVSQNQLLVDLLGAVNALTAALLAKL